MKKLLIITALLMWVTTAFLPAVQISSIYGVVDPPKAAKRVMAISAARDTLVVIPQDGRFSIAVAGGTWKLFVEAVPPFHDSYVVNIKVTEGRSTDVGILRLTR
jgi:hypothetical protein